MAKAKEDAKKKQVKEAELVAEASPVKQPKAKAEAPAAEADSPTKTTAKSGRRSAKSIRAAEEKLAKEEKKTTATETAQPAKPVAKQTRSKLERASKRYRAAAGAIDKSKTYPLPEALDLACKSSTTKFDGSIELHINLGVDPRQADQNVRDTVVLPAGTGKSIKVAVLAEADDATEAKAAGADQAGTDEILNKLEKEEIDFDVLIATPALMPRLGKYARLLGPRGLMPNPKSGTVSTDPAAAVKDAKAGRVEYRVDQAGIIHLGIGKASFAPEKLQQNAEAILASIRAAKPASLKGIYIKSVFVSSTMGPSIKVETP